MARQKAATRQVQKEGPGALQHQRARERRDARRACTRLAHSSLDGLLHGSFGVSSSSGRMKRRARGIEVEQLRIAAPVDGRLQLAQRLLLR